LLLFREIEVKERKDRVDDAMHSTRAAVEQGILPGGGVALLRATKALEKLRVQNGHQRVGLEIVRKAISAPARQIALNAGEDGSIIVGKILRMMLKDELDAQGLATKPDLAAPAAPSETAASQRAGDCTGQQTFPQRRERVGTWSPLRSDQGSSGVTSVVTHVTRRGVDV
jgi:hypothetical protein